MTTILDAYNKCNEKLKCLSDFDIGRGLGWAKFTETRIVIKTQAFTELATFQEHFFDTDTLKEEAHGWVLWQRESNLSDRLAVLEWNKFLEQLINDKVPLDAEFGNESTSIALHYQRGGWHVTLVREIASDEDQVIIALACEQTYLFRPPAPGNLRYKIYWQFESGFGYRPVVARFLGFMNQGV